MNQTGEASLSAVPIPSFELDVQRGSMPGCPNASILSDTLFVYLCFEMFEQLKNISIAMNHRMASLIVCCNFGLRLNGETQHIGQLLPLNLAIAVNNDKLVVINCHAAHGCHRALRFDAAAKLYDEARRGCRNCRSRWRRF